MLIVAYIVTIAASLLHFFIFVLESILWTTDRARKVFGTTPEEAVATQSMAFNQGFYNAFLGVLGLVGAVTAWGGGTAVGHTLIIAGLGSMAAAAAVLFLSSKALRPSAIKQGALPVLGLVLLLIGSLI